MAPIRACEQCRAAKARCDLIRPTCGRCSQRNLTCSGPAESGFLFLAENEVAQRNSMLARRPRSLGRGQIVANSSPSQTSEDPQPSELPTEGSRKLYYWLNDTALAEVPGPLKRDTETRAVERFFLDWTLNPTNDGVAPGYMHDLPLLYASAAPGSVLWHAVRAVAFADLKDYDRGSFSSKARQNYGGALTRMRSIAEDSQRLAEDRILAALLLIDNFEAIYLSRLEPLGAHKDAIAHALDVRGEEQFYDRSRFELWRIATLRLQAMQIIQREEPDDGQLAWISKLNTSLPDMHICADVMRMVILCAAARKLVESGAAVELEEAVQLADTMQELIASMEVWTVDLAGVWRPKDIGSGRIAGYGANVALPLWPGLPVLRYNDLWLAYKWNFHVASQIVLRESLVETLEYSAQLQQHLEPDPRIQEQADAVVRLSADIVASLPPLLGLVHEPSHRGILREAQGKMAGRFFAVCALRVIERSRFASVEHKDTATGVLRWLDEVHRLG
ncbi:hypothetical protein LTR37_020486 [Vermiconidia calcicola]|uniref:Uncharacterized protein n=1 Tax=Vermiconidia calcicola TaxID=1690605 RepID=A0ACC3ME76_9PEZI|nr:hypothetical protein LTR37_020486 [Vermiconidia calcicola]